MCVCVCVCVCVHMCVCPGLAVCKQKYLVYAGSMPGYDGNGPNPNVVTGEGRSKGPRGGSADATGAYNQVIGSKR